MLDERSEAIRLKGSQDLADDLSVLLDDRSKRNDHDDPGLAMGDGVPEREAE